MADVISDEQLLANDIIIATGDTGENYDYTINSPLTIQEETKRAPSRAPEVGQHNTEVLLELGLSESQIEQLKAQGVIVSEETK